jgi:small subunit ribosomal protein S20
MKTKSAKKRLKQEIKRRERNLAYKRKFKGLFKKIKKLLLANKKEEAISLLPQVYKALDKAAKTGAIKKGQADRKKSRLTKMINKKLKT